MGRPTNRSRIAVLHQGCVPTYRQDFYERLGMLAERQYVIFHGQPEPGSGVAAAPPPFHFEHAEVRNRFWRILGRTLVYQPVFLRVAQGHFDAIVIGHEVKYPVNLALAVWFRLMGKPVLLWGFGRNIDLLKGRRSRLGRAFGRVVNRAQGAMMRLATDFLAYTGSGAVHAAATGMPQDRVTVLNNTIDISGEIVAYEQAAQLDRGELRRSLGLDADGVVLLFLGRINAEKKVDRLIVAVGELRRQGRTGIELLIVGSGPDELRLRALAKGEDGCRFLGQVIDRERLSRIMRVSDALVIPGYVGLAVNHAFAHGLPVITCASDLHSPEIEYILPEVNGLILPGLGELAEGLRRFVDSPELRGKLAAGALASREKLDLQRMVEGFDSGVRRAIERAAPRQPSPDRLLETR